jgi:hypothetical protein
MNRRTLIGLTPALWLGTMMQGYVATHGTSPATRKVPYDPTADFSPIGMIGGQTQAMFPGLAAAMPHDRKIQLDS